MKYHWLRSDAAKVDVIIEFCFEVAMITENRVCIQGDTMKSKMEIHGLKGSCSTTFRICE